MSLPLHRAVQIQQQAIQVVVAVTHARAILAYVRQIVGAWIASVILARAANRSCGYICSEQKGDPKVALLYIFFIFFNLKFFS